MGKNKYRSRWHGELRIEMYGRKKMKYHLKRKRITLAKRKGQRNKKAEADLGMK